LDRKRYHPDFEYMLHTDKDLRNLVKSHYPEYLKMYDGFEYNIMRVDFGRICALDRFGGIYSDLEYGLFFDCSCFNLSLSFDSQAPNRNVEPMFRNGQCEAYFAAKSFALVTNSLMASRPGAKIWKTIMENIREAWETGKYAMLNRHFYILYTTGPWMVTSTISSFEDGVVGLLPTSFNPSEKEAEEEEEGETKPKKMGWMRKLPGSGSWHQFDSAALEVVARNHKLFLTLAMMAILVFFICVVYGFIVGIRHTVSAGRYLVNNHLIRQSTDKPDLFSRHTLFSILSSLVV
jgi:Glycosyltransferase sugar-binding region containing DXD motif